MGAERSSKRSYSQIDAHIELDETSQHSSEASHDDDITEIEVYELSEQAAERPTGLTDAQSEVSKPPQQSSKRPHRGTEFEIEAGELSKRPCLEARRLVHPCSFTYAPPKHSLHRAKHTSSTRDPPSLNPGTGPSSCKTVRRPDANFDQRRLLDPDSFVTRHHEYSPINTFPTPLLHSTRPSNPNPAAPSRPSFEQLAADGQQGMKVLFLIDHATKGDAVHFNISRFVHPASTEMKRLMSKYRSDRSNFQSRFFGKARTICAALTSRREFVEMEASKPNIEKRISYFRDRCTKSHLSAVYSPIASAVDIHRILAARTPTDRAFRDLMTQVFVHSMEDLWCFELHPSKQDLSARLEKESKEDVYNRFKALTDRVNGLPAARGVPGYLDVPLRAEFPRYVFFSQDPRPRNEEDIYESDGERGDGDEWR